MPYLGKEPKNITTLSDLSVSGNVTSTGTVEPAGDTAAGDDAAIGFTSAEGLILTGQGSTSDITLKNDADATVFTVPTGTDDILFPDGAKCMFGASSDLQISHNGSYSLIADSGTGNLILACEDFSLTNPAVGENMITAAVDGAVTLYHDNAAKIATASTGVTITGGFTATDGCTITTADNDPQLTLVSTDADANEGPILKFHRNSASPADNDLIGQLLFHGEDGAGNDQQYANIQSIIMNNAQGNEDGRLTFRTLKAGTATSRLDISNAETVFNDSSVDVDFRVESNGNANMLIVDGGNNSVMVGDNTGASYSDGGLFVRHAGGANNSSLCVVNGTTSGTLRLVDFFGGTSTSRVGSIQVESGSVAFNTSSDYRLKENVNYTWDATTRLKQLKPVQFNWISDDTNTAIDGFLAHEVSSIVPSAISGEKDEVWTDGSPMYQQIDQSKLVPLLCKTILELEARIAALEA